MSLSLDTKGSLVFSGSTGFSSAISCTAPAAARALTIPDPGASCNVQLVVRNTTSVNSAATGLAAVALSNSGSIIAVTNTAGGYNIALPVPTALGQNFTFILAVGGAGGVTTIGTAAAANCSGVLLSGVVAGGAANSIAFAAGRSTVNFTNTALPGDKLEFVCHIVGQWVVYGLGGAAASFAVTA